VSGLSNQRTTVVLAPRVDLARIELAFPECHSGVLPLDDKPISGLGRTRTDNARLFRPPLYQLELPDHVQRLVPESNRSRRIDNPLATPAASRGKTLGCPKGVEPS
jgi:hypothetical protein